MPAMLAAGRAAARWGWRATAAFLALLGLAGSPWPPRRGTCLVGRRAGRLGALSGAADVAINTAAGRAQQAHGCLVLARGHAAFSVAVVVMSMVTGQFRSLGVPLSAAFVLVAAAAVATAVHLLTT